MKRYILAWALLACAACAQAHEIEPFQDDYGDDRVWAEVVDVQAVRGYEEEQVVQRRCSGVRSSDRAGATVVGALIGGALGNTVGKGDGRRAATLAGALIGGTAGANARYPNDGRYCQDRVVLVPIRHAVDYDVTYRYGGRLYRARMDHDPGDRILVSVRPVGFD